MGKQFKQLYQFQFVRKPFIKMYQWWHPRHREGYRIKEMFDPTTHNAIFHLATMSFFAFLFSTMWPFTLEWWGMMNSPTAQSPTWIVDILGCLGIISAIIAIIAFCCFVFVVGRWIICNAILGKKDKI